MAWRVDESLQGLFCREACATRDTNVRPVRLSTNTFVFRDQWPGEQRPVTRLLGHPCGDHLDYRASFASRDPGRRDTSRRSRIEPPISGATPMLPFRGRALEGSLRPPSHVVILRSGVSPGVVNPPSLRSRWKWIVVFRSLRP